MRIARVAQIGALLGVTAVACADPVSRGADDGQRDDPVVDDPPARALGSLLVTAPTHGTVEKTTSSVGAVEQPLGAAFGDLPTGEVSFLMETQGDWISFSAWHAATIAPNQTTTILTGLLGVHATSGPPTLGLRDLVGRAGITLVSGNDRGIVDPASDGSKLAPLVEGTYAVDFGVAGTDGVSVSITSGQTSSVVLTDTTSRRIARLHAPARTLPDATCDAQLGRWELGLEAISPWPGAKPPTPEAFDIADGEEIDIGISARHEGAIYTLKASAWQDVLDVPIGERGAGPRAFALGRLDVSEPTEGAGTYAIFAADDSGVATGPNLLACAPATGTGVDVLPGHYRIEITTASGAVVRIVDATR